VSALPDSSFSGIAAAPGDATPCFLDLCRALGAGVPSLSPCLPRFWRTASRRLWSSATSFSTLLCSSLASTSSLRKTSTSSTAFCCRSFACSNSSRKPSVSLTKCSTGLETAKACEEHAFSVLHFPPVDSCSSAMLLRARGSRMSRGMGSVGSAPLPRSSVSPFGVCCEAFASGGPSSAVPALHVALPRAGVDICTGVLGGSL